MPSASKSRSERAAAPRPTAASDEPKPKLDALPDTLDFRDRLYVPTLITVPPRSDIDGYRTAGVPVLDQGREGACTGYALATVANYLMRVRGRDPSADEVSAWMLYTMAKRYDDWPGEDYDGSSARGAMKGWYKNGLCAARLWKDRNPDASISVERAADALKRPLGAYFRVNHKDLVAMHAALTEVGVLFATATVHSGWQDLASGGDAIRFGTDPIGGHAFAIVGYNGDGFWIQNSWGEGWGNRGIALLSYDDWLANGNDVWVATLGAPVHLSRPVAGASMRAGAPRRYESQIYAELRPHIVMCKNDGILDEKGDYGLTPQALADVVTRQIPTRMEGWGKKRLLLYAHGGLVPQDSAIQMVANNRDPLLRAEIYPLSFIWRSDAWTTIKDILQDALSRRRDEGVLDRAKDFMLDRLDDMLEPVARLLGGKALWDEMKENATGATAYARGAARQTADLIADLVAEGRIDELYLVGHSAGAIFHAPLARYLADKRVRIDGVTLWAPACTMDMFEQTYRPLAQSGAIGKFDLYVLGDASEQRDDCANIYHKSLLYLVSNAFEERARIPLIQPGCPLLGLQRDARSIERSFWTADRKLHVAPGPDSNATHHGDFDNDPATLLSTLRRITGSAVDKATRRAALDAPNASQDQRRRFREKLNVAMLA